MMNRRQFLTVAGTALLAGCTFDSTTDDGATFDRDGGVSATAMSTPTAESAATIADAALISAGSVTAASSGTVPWARIDVENTAEARHGLLTLQLRFYDESDSLLETRQGRVRTLPAETTWRYYHRFTQGVDTVDRLEASILEATPRPPRIVSDGASVVGSEMAADPESGVTVTGRVDVSREMDQLLAIALVYDDAGRLRGTLTAPGQSLPAGETWRFETVGDISIRTPPNVDAQPVDHEVLLATL